MSSPTIPPIDALNTITSSLVTKEELNSFKSELEEYKAEVKKIEKMSKTNSWKNSKKK